MNGRTRRSIVQAGLLPTLVIACDAPRPTAPASVVPNVDVSASVSDAAVVRQLAAARQIVPLPPTPYVRPALARLGQALAFDKKDRFASAADMRVAVRSTFAQLKEAVSRVSLLPGGPAMAPTDDPSREVSALFDAMLEPSIVIDVSFGEPTNE